MSTVNIKTTKDNALSLLGLLSIIEIDYRKSEDNELFDEILRVINEVKKDIRDGLDGI